MGGENPRDAASDQVTTVTAQALASFDIDLDRCSFLRDHRVGDAVLLPTVLQLDLVAATVVRPGDGFRATRVRVLEPVIISETEPTRVLVTRSAAGQALRGVEGSLHLTVSVETEAADVLSVGLPSVGPSRPSVVDVALAGTADLVYPPLFHGPAFQVLSTFGWDGGALVARLAPTSAYDRSLRSLHGDGGVVPAGCWRGCCRPAGSGSSSRPVG